MTLMAQRRIESGRRGGALLPAAALVLFLLGAPIALAGQDGGGAEAASHKGTHAKASKNQLNKRTKSLRQLIEALQGQITGLSSSGGPSTPTGPAGGDLALTILYRLSTPGHF